MNVKSCRLIFLFAGIVCSMTNLWAGDSGCQKCEMIREQNASHPQKSQYYEDYLKEHPEDRSRNDVDDDDDKPSQKRPLKQPKQVR